MRAFLLLVVCGLAAAQERPRLSPEVEHVLGLARAAQPEFAADALLRVVEAGLIADEKTRKELLEDAFTLAGSASQKLKKMPLVRSSAPGSVAFRLEAANRKGLSLDTQSLQIRAIRLSGDKRLFERALRWRIPPISCEEPFVWDVAEFYQMTGELFPARVGDLFDRMQSPVEYGPAMELLAKQETKEGLTPLLDRFLAAVERVQGDDRSFTATEAAVPRMLERLASQAERLGLEPGRVLKVLPGYLERHMTGVRCHDTAAQAAATEASLLWYYNNQMRRSLPPIDSERLRPSRLEGPMAPVVELEPVEFKRLRGLVADKAFDEGLAGWKDSPGMAESELLYWKCRLLQESLEEGGTNREERLRTYGELLANSKLQESSAGEWLAEVEEGLKHPEIRAQLESSANPALSVYARLRALQNGRSGRVPGTIPL